TNNRPYSQKNRLIIRASVLPDDPNWTPASMPILLSCEDPRVPGKPDAYTETYSIKVKINHVTIQGLKFLGNPTLNNMHGCVERIGKELDDLLIKQCIFIGDRYGAGIYAATLATGDRFVVEHCIFKGCAASAVYWDGLEEIGGRNCAMRYCIIDEAYMSGPWTCQTTEDFEFHNNIVANCEYFWIRKQGDCQKYKINKCVIIGNKHFSGYGTAAGPTSETGDEVSYEKVEVITNGTLEFDTNQKSRNYMHITKGSVGSELGAGIFMPRKD
ncbi:MAG: right-handed parallel beta-helix repeat-containing protein, partial [Sedimentisphaerales bacterium]|nr:right-handed parallel beta-helix repeat-containing protein [Sedimentisphaerales bacterium]